MEDRTMIYTWRITPTQNIRLELASPSLDAVTRQLPDGYYSTFRTYDECRRVIGLKAHLRRLYVPVSQPDVDASFLRRQLVSLLAPYRPGEARVRAIMSKQGQVYIVIEPLKLLSKELYDNGVRVETTRIQRNNPRLKSTAFISASDSERQHIAKEDVFEALLERNGRILEGMTSNFFYILDGVLCTARRDILLGVTRGTVICVARRSGLDVRYRALKLDELSAVDEAFITSSSRGVVPVIQIDDVRMGHGKPGKISKQLSTAYEAHVLERADKI